MCTFTLKMENANNPQIVSSQSFYDMGVKFISHFQTSIERFLIPIQFRELAKQDDI